MGNTHQSSINLESQLWGTNFPNYIIPDPNHCMPQSLRLWFLFPSVLQTSTLYTGSCYSAAGERPAICYLTQTLLRSACSCLPLIFHLMPAKCLDYSPGYCHCSAARVGREERGHCPAHCSEEQESLGYTLDEQFGWWVFFPTVCHSTLWEQGYGMGEIFP